MRKASGHDGPVALVGSGEYLDVMLETDRWLLEQVGGPARARVVVLPTASGLEEPSSPARWMRMGIEHFTRLGAQGAAAPILDRAAAHDPQWTELLSAADLIYFSGGNPHHVVATLRGTPAWDVVLRRHHQGAALAGCSAGAMALCGLMVDRLRAAHDGAEPAWQPALDVLPALIVLPHFDRMAAFVGHETLARTLAAVPAGSTLVGIDEDTALVRLDATQDAAGSTSWQVMGRRSVSLFSREGHTVHQPGEVVHLHATAP
jgi:cyanophycinase